MKVDLVGNSKLLYKTLRKLRKVKRNPLENMKDKGRNLNGEQKILDLLGATNTNEKLPTKKIKEQETEQKEDIIKEVTQMINKIKIEKAPEIVKVDGAEENILFNGITNIAWFTPKIPIPIHKKGKYTNFIN